MIRWAKSGIAASAAACCIVSLATDLSGQRPAARAQFDSGAAALKRSDALGAVAAYRNAITLDPTYYDAHEAFIKATRRVYEKADTAWDFSDTVAVRRRVAADSLANSALAQEYARWAARQPRVAAYQWALGTLEGERPEAEAYYKRAVALDPKLARAYQWLSLIAQFRGDDAAATEYMRQASEADPGNADYAFSYAWDFRETDPARYRAMMLDIARRFPTNMRGAQALNFLVWDVPTDSERIVLYEQLRAQFPPEKFGWSMDGMEGLYDLYARTAPAQALALAQDMLRQSTTTGDQPGWALRLVFARNLVLAESLLADAKAAAASAVLAATQIPKYSLDQEMFALLKARAADAASNTKMAYDSLLARFATTPTDTLSAALTRYGAKLGKTPVQVDSEIWAVRDRGAKPAAPFKLPSYREPADSISLASYTGKVVLLTFWFPGCGPCRGEFPHFQRVVDAFKGKGVAYVGVNVVPNQDPYVLPFMRGTRFTFTPVRGSDAFARDAYHVRGEPTNFLIDGRGRIIFQDFRINDAGGERMLTLMIESMLARSTGAALTEAGR